MEKLLVRDEEILKYYGWEEICKSPAEIQHLDGSFASGQAMWLVMNSLREEYILEKYEELMSEMRELGVKNKILKDYADAKNI
jgi:hypothetical protein